MRVSESLDSSEVIDDGPEEEVEHDATEIRWMTNTSFQDLNLKGKLSDVGITLGEMVWIATENRDQVILSDTVPEQYIYFHMNGHRTAVDLFLTGLMVDKFWRKVANHSLTYYKLQNEGCQRSEHTTHRLQVIYCGCSLCP